MIPKEMVEAATNAYCKWLNGMPEGTPAALREGMEAALTAALSSPVPEEIEKAIGRLRHEESQDYPAELYVALRDGRVTLERLAHENERLKDKAAEDDTAIHYLRANRDDAETRIAELESELHEVNAACDEQMRRANRAEAERDAIRAKTIEDLHEPTNAMLKAGWDTLERMSLLETSDMGCMYAIWKAMFEESMRALASRPDPLRHGHDDGGDQG